MTVYCSVCGLELTDPDDISRGKHLECSMNDDDAIINESTEDNLGLF